MKFNAARFAVMAACVAVAASAHAQTGDWGDLAVVSGTVGNNANRLCLGVPASMRPADIGCPAYAPYVSATSGFVGLGTPNPATTLHVENPNFNRQLLITRGGGSGYYLTQSGNVGSIGAYGTTNQFSIFGSALSVMNSGNVGIGTTSPNAKLDVYGTISATNLLINGQPIGQADRITSGTTNVIATQDRSVTISTAGTQRVVIGENGRVGIGTTNPGTQLQVDGGPIFANGTGTSLYVRDIAAFRSKITNDSGAALILSGGTGNITQVSGSFIVSTSAQTTTPSLYVGTNGNVGIGTATPQSIFQVSQQDGAILRLDTKGSAGTTAAPKKNTIAFYGYGGATGALRAEIISEDRAASVANYSNLYFNLINSSASSQTRMFIAGATGNIGIGTTNPTRTLDISGSANISGTVKIAGSGAEPCDSSSVGTIRYNAAAQAFQMCRP